MGFSKNISRNHSRASRGVLSELVVVAPHPDDEWIGAGCSILRAREKGVSVKILVVTGRVKSRVEICERLAKKHGCKIEFLGFQEGAIARDELSSSLAKMMPMGAIIYVPSADKHRDHLAVHDACMAAFEKTHLMIEYGIYAASRNIFTRLFSWVKERINGSATISFRKGRGFRVSYGLHTKKKYIALLDETPRSHDLVRPIVPRDKRLLALMSKDYHVSTVDAGFSSTLSVAKGSYTRGFFPVLVQNKGFSSHYTRAASEEFEVFDGVCIVRPHGVRQRRSASLFNPVSVYNRIIAPARGVRSLQKSVSKSVSVIHGSSSSPILAASTVLAGLLTSTRNTVHTIRSRSTIRVPFFKGILFLNMIRKVVCPSTNILEDLVSKGLKRHRGVHISTGIDTKKYSASTSQGEVIRRKHNIPRDAPIVFYYGKGGHFKGVDVLIRAFENIEDKDAHLLLVHPVVWLPHIVKLVQTSRVKNRIHLCTGKVNVVEYLGVATMVVLPYRSIAGTEATPLCLVESMAAAVPLISSDLPEIREIVTAEKTALLAKPGDATSVKIQIDRLLASPELRKKLAFAAKKDSKQFDSKVMQEKIYETYQ